MLLIVVVHQAEKLRVLVLQFRNGTRRTPGCVSRYEEFSRHTGIRGRSPLWDLIFPFDIRMHIVYDGMHGMLYGVLPDVAEGLFLQKLVESEAAENVRRLGVLDLEFQSVHPNGVERITRSLKYYKDFTGELGVAPYHLILIQ